MKIKWVRGCVVTYLSIDKKSFKDYNDKQKNDIRQNILNWLKNEEKSVPTEDLIEFILEYAGEYECSDEPCECCGDFIDKYELEI